MKKPKQPEWKSGGLYEMYVEPGGHVYFSPTESRFVCVLCGYEAPDCDDIVRHSLFDCDAMKEEWE